MSDYTPSIGDRVRVTVEGTVEVGVAAVPILAPISGVIVVLSPPVLGQDCVTVEKLADPKPEWQPGDVVRDDSPVCHGLVFVRSHIGDWIDPYGRRHDDGEFAERCPLTLLVRNGRAVTA